MTRYNNTLGTQVAVFSDYTRDAAGRLVGLSHAKGANTLASYTYAYDRADWLTQVASSADGTVDYSYDAAGQLTGADYSAAPPDEAYSYDANGNRTNTGYATGANNRLTSDGTYTYEYDNEGNRTRRTKTATGEVTEYAWDHRNRLTQVTVRGSLGGPATLTVAYAYDQFNRLALRTEDPDGDGPLASTGERYLYDGDRRVVTVDAADGVTVKRRDLWGVLVDQVLADEAPVSNTVAGPVLWPLADHLGTLRDLAQYDAALNQTTVANHRVYDAFGDLKSETNAAVDHIFAYTGRMFDEISGLQNNLNRWYDPKVARWLSEDPIGFEAGDANLYRYVGNASTLAVDPDGLDRVRIGASQQGEVLWEVDPPPAPLYVTILQGAFGWNQEGTVLEVGRIKTSGAGAGNIVVLSSEFGGREIPYDELQKAAHSFATDPGASLAEQKAAIRQAIERVRAGKHHTETYYQDAVVGFIDSAGQALYDLHHAWGAKGYGEDYEGNICYDNTPAPRFSDDRERLTGNIVGNKNGPGYHKGQVLYRASECAAMAAGSGALRKAPRGTPGPSGRLSTQKYLENNWDKGTFGNVSKSIEYHVGKHGKGLSPVEYTQRAQKAYANAAAKRTKTTDLQGRSAVRVDAPEGSGLFTPHGRIIWFHPG